MQVRPPTVWFRLSSVRRGREALGRVGVAAIAMCTLLGGGVLVASPAHAADASLTVNKQVNGAETRSVTPGGEFTYSIVVGCDDNDCVDAQLTDQLPAEFAGFAILGTSVTPSGQPSTYGYTGCTSEVTASCLLTANFLQQLTPTEVGIKAGDTYTVSVTLKAPQDLSPSWPSNGVAVTNTATATSTTADQKSDTAEVTVTIPVNVATTVGKTWAPATQQFQPGADSTITLTSRNTSNIAASTLVVQDPTSAADGSASLTAGNPFALVDFAGFGAVIVPAGATTVQVDAYVFDSGSGTYGWQAGTPQPPASIALPAGVSNGQVAGLRFTYAGASGATIDPNGAAGSVAIDVEQRSTNRISGASLVTGVSVTNGVTGTVTVPGHGQASDTASAPYTIGALSVAVVAGKTITPNRIPAGTTAAATITGKNTSNGPLDTLDVADTNFFTATLRFGGFSAPLSYPAGATSATIRWTYSDGSDQVEPFASGATPTPPGAPAGEHLTGFVLRYSGAIEAGQTASAEFDIAPTAGFVSEAASPSSVTNTVRVAGSNPAGSASDTDPAALAIFYPDIALQISKTITPSGAVSPGGTVVAQLPTTTSADSAYVKPTSIVVEDIWRPTEPTDFWNAFNPIAIAPTQVLAGSKLTVEYTTDNGSSWVTLDQVDATGGAQVYSANLPSGLVGTIDGLRYTFTQAGGFPRGTSVSPNTVFQARATLRDSGFPTSVADAGPSAYENRGFAQATGAVDGVPLVMSDVVEAFADGAIQTFSGGSGAGLVASKNWRTSNFGADLSLLSSQSAAQAGTLLGWGVTQTGYSSVTITDPATGASTPGQTVFQAFDLRSIAPRSFASDPLLRWDTVSMIERYASGSWTTVTPPSGGWMNATGFRGYTLTSAQSAATTGVRITVVPNDAARASSSNPLAPPVGSGVATSTASGTRTFGLVWELRNIKRVPDPGRWVSAGETFNGGTGAIVNTVGIAGVQDGVDRGPRVASDTVTLIDQPPAVQVTKTSSKSTVVLPEPGDVDPSVYPTNEFTVTARNTATSRASYVRVTDPMPCAANDLASCLSAPNDWGADPYASATYDPATNPFERLDLTDLTFTVPAAQVSSTASTVTLWRRSAAGALSTSAVSLAAAEAMNAAALADVVGISVVYQGANPATAGGSIVSGANLVMRMTTRVRSELRSDLGMFVTPSQVDNHTFAQSYDPVLFPSGQQSTPSDSATGSLTLVSGRLDVAANKVITPSVLLEADRTDPVTATLSANQGTASVATNQVTLSDTDSDFWNTFALTGLSAADVSLPSGADQVRVDVQLNGGSSWTNGAFAPAAALPSVPLPDVTGIRFVFNRADGEIFSRSAVPADWTATAVLHLELLDEHRDGSPIGFPSSVEDTVDAESRRYEDPEVYRPATAQASDDIALATGDFGLDVAKTPAGNIHSVTAGEPNLWTLEFSNTGTGLVTVDRLVDTIPTHLSWDGVEPTYATSSGGLLSTDVVATYDQNARELVFTWPTGGQRMAPGERFTITVNLVLEPGLTSGQRATNQIIVDTAQNLARCTNTSGNGQGTIAGLPADQCGTTNYVQPTPGASLVTTKGVKGDVVDPLVSGAVNVTNPQGPCLTDSQGYYRSPCAAKTVVGGTDEWKLHAVNSGTVAYERLTFVDPLPFAGDRLLATGSSRGSTYRPVLDGTYTPVFSAPAGTATTWQVTTASDVCVGSGPSSAWPADPTCAANPNPSEWADGSTFSGDWAEVTGIRVVMDFAGTTSGAMDPGAAVTVRYRTVNAPVTSGASDRAPVAAPVDNEFAWNQSGVVARTTTNQTIARAPVKAGVTLLGGPLQVTKVVTGPAASAAPDSFVAGLACTVAGAPVDLGANATVTLNPQNQFVGTVVGIPLGATCTVDEHGAVGEYGEYSRTVEPGSLEITTPAEPDDVPAGQAATITNVYEYGQLSIGKTASASNAAPGDDVAYTLTVKNTGKLTATDVVVTDTVPSGATVRSVTADGQVNGNVITWTIPTLAPGESTTLGVVLRFAAAGTFVNRAAIVTPPGPWLPPTVDQPCIDVPTESCASVEVTTAPAPNPPSNEGGVDQPNDSGADPAGGTDDSLPVTGAPTWVLGQYGALLLFAGLLLLVAVRRRGSSHR